LTGKQTLRPGGCSYTACSGIWQTVWLEPVPPAHVEGLKIVTDINKGVLHLTVMGRMPPKPIGVEVSVLEGQKRVATGQAIAGSEITEEVRKNLVDFYKATSTWFSTHIEIAIPEAKLWTPDDPFLYGLAITLIDEQGQKLDEVDSYFGMRTISIQPVPQGFTRLLLNNQPILLFGALDQGYWPDGIYTAPTDEALRYDIEAAKQLGLNCVRKHVKIESRRWYYWADKLGLLVLQDMPTGREGNPKTDMPISPEASMQCELEKRNLIQQFFNHPSIIMWILFNEGWGQHDTLRHVEVARQLDSTRLINEASGFPWHGGGDVVDTHGGIPPKDPKRIGITSETGGWGVATPGHDWTGPLWTYRTYNPRTGGEISGMLENLHGNLPLLDQDAKQWFSQKVAYLFYRFREDHEETGQIGIFYCQLIDVETEIDGLLSYDRAVWKVDQELIQRVCKGQMLPGDVLQPVIKILTQPTLWRYTLEEPPDSWYMVDFDDSSWKEGLSGFGTSTEGAIVGTSWTTENIWLRRSFEVPETLYSTPPTLLMLHDEDAEVYINGVLAVRVNGFSVGYEEFEMTPESIAALRPGRNEIAVHCHQTVGGQFIDVEIWGITIDNNGTSTPSLESTLTAWFKADALTGISNGDAVDNWADLSGKGHNAVQILSNRCPTYMAEAMNGHPVIRFNAVDSSYLAFPRPIQDDFTIILVYQSNQGLGKGTQFYQGAGLVSGEVPGVTDDFGTCLNADGRLIGGTGNPDTNVVSRPGFNDGQPHVMTFKRLKSSDNVSLLSLYVDGVHEDSVLGGAQSLTAPNRLVIGAQQVENNFLTGDIAEVRLYDIALFEADRNTIEIELINQYIRGMPAAAADPYPPDGDKRLPVNIVLKWKAGTAAMSHDIYLSRLNEPLVPLGSQQETTYVLGPLAYSTTYAWRIDEVNADGKTIGSVWTFTTAAAGDLDLNGQVDFEDFVFFALHWLEECMGNNNGCKGADIDFSGNVDLWDLAWLARNWMFWME